METKPKKPSEYGDGTQLTHYQGNDEYPNGANWPDEESPDQELLEGKIAFGNIDFPEEIEDELRDMYGF